MFTLKFFILFVLAGLCFGDESASGTGISSEVDGGSSSNTQGNAASDGQEAEKEQEGSAGKATDGHGGDGKKDSGKHAGQGLPDFIGDEKIRKQYVDTLVTMCGGSSVWKVNEKKINASLPRCTYICEGINNSSATSEQRIPKDMVCGPNNAKCGAEGDCPVNLPSC
uniref:Putative ixodes 8-cys protein n=1 Tax=Ixodes ricinus TaxID=34613 RepID=A0A0K8RAA1_IXORI